MKFKLFLLIFFSAYNIIFSQEGGLNYFKSNYAFPNTTVPEKASLLRFNEFPNIEAAGGTKISIPIYTIKMDGLEIPIALTYNTKGNKVSDIASNIGLGWSLIGDGSVECQINDLNDFELNTTLYDDIQFEPTPIPYQTLSGYLVPSNNPQLGVGTSWRKDYSPDFYIINAPGLQNKFYLKKDLSVCPYDNCNYLTNRFKAVFFEEQFIKSDFVKRENYDTNIGGDYDHERNANIKKFTFTSNKGFVYKFIDPIGILTKNYSIGALNSWISDGISYNDTNWKLSQIISPNSNNFINYQYESFSNNYLHPQLIRNDSHYTDDFNMGGLVRGFSNNRYYNTRSVTVYGNTKRLKKISSNDVEIIFSYDENRTDYAGGRLKTIEITNKFSGAIINTFTFYHSYFIPNEICNDPYDCYRLRLDRITDSKSGDYVFAYDNGASDYKFPRRSSSKIDYAGYFNGNNSDIRMFSDNEAGSVSPNANYYPHGKFYYYAGLTEDNYIPFKLNNQTLTSVYGDIDLSSNTSSLIGLLTNIKYPTAGAMKIIYENDQFNYLGSDYLLGSARIKSMELFDHNNVLAKKINYEYKLANGKSSGLIAGFIPPSDNGSYTLVVGLELLNNNTVLYSKIVENIENKGRIEYYYSNFDKFPDRHGKLSTCIPSNVWCTNYSNGLKQAKELKYPYMSIYKPDVRRGILERKIFFNSNNDKIQENNYEYAFVKKDSLFLESAFSAGPPSSDPIRNGSLNFNGGRTNYFYTYTNQIKKDNNAEYFNNSVVSTDNYYYYNPNHNELIRLVTKLPDESVMETSYQYAYEKNNQKLLEANIITVPLEIAIVKKKNLNDNNGKIISKKEIKYDNPLNKLPTSILSINTDNNTMFIETTYDQYDEKGNLLQYTTKGGASTTIIWGYNQTQPIAKVEGARLTDVPQLLITNIITASNNDNMPLQGITAEQAEQNLIIALDNFRKDAALSGYQITTYSYDPLIGVKSITPPSGVREIYLYDAAGRLKEVREHSQTGKIIKDYQYHYKNQ